MNVKLLWDCGVVCGTRAVSVARDALLPERSIQEDDGMLVFTRGDGTTCPEAGISKLAITVILTAVGVSLTLAVLAILGPEILDLATRTGDAIGGTPLEFSE